MFLLPNLIEQIYDTSDEEVSIQTSDVAIKNRPIGRMGKNWNGKWKQWLFF